MRAEEGTETNCQGRGRRRRRHRVRGSGLSVRASSRLGRGGVGLRLLPSHGSINRVNDRRGRRRSVSLNRRRRAVGNARKDRFKELCLSIEGSVTCPRLDHLHGGLEPRIILGGDGVRRRRGRARTTSPIRHKASESDWSAYKASARPTNRAGLSEAGNVSGDVGLATGPGAMPLGRRRETVMSHS